MAYYLMSCQLVIILALTTMCRVNAIGGCASTAVAARNSSYDNCNWSNARGGISLDCTARSLYRVPEEMPSNLVELDLSENYISFISSDAFSGCLKLTKLDLSDNLIENITVDVFTNLFLLQELYLDNNKLNLSSPFLFNPLNRSLKILTLQGNLDLDDLILTNLTRLQFLALDSPVPSPNFGKSFENLKNVTTLQILGNLKTIEDDTFDNLYMTPIKTLTISSSCLTNVSSMCFGKLRHLKELNIVEQSDLQRFSGLSNAWYGLNFTQIKSLNLSAVIPCSKQATILTSEFYNFLNLTRIRKIYLDRNNIVEIRFGLSKSLPHLEELGLSYNRLSNIEKFILDISLLNEIRYIDCSHQLRRYVKHLNKSRKRFNATRSSLLSKLNSQSYVEANCSTPVSLKNPNLWCLSIPDRLEVLNLTSSLNVDVQTIPAVNISGEFNLRLLNYSGNGIHAILGPIFIMKPNPNIPLTIDVSSNDIVILNENVLEDTITRGLNLQKLILSRNDLSDQLRQDTEGHTFKHYTNLTELHISGNKLGHLPQLIFSKVTQLEILNLSWNFMQSIDFNVDQFVQLKRLDLGSNLLTELKATVRKNLDALMYRQANFSINLVGNPMSCSCKTLDFVLWMERNKLKIANFENTMCFFNDKQKSLAKLQKSIIPKLRFECSKGHILTIVLILFSVTFVGLIVSVLLYRHRWDIRYFLLKSTLKGREYQQLLDQLLDYQYEAFVSYDQDDKPWVTNELVKNLENQAGSCTTEQELDFRSLETEPLRLCLHQRDFEPGKSIQENILTAMEKSKKVILIVSKNFVQSNWCAFETDIARMQCLERGRNLIVPILLESVPMEDMSASLQCLIRRHTYIEWREGATDREEFWKRLKRVLRDPGFEPWTCECGHTVGKTQQGTNKQN